MSEPNANHHIDICAYGWEVTDPCDLERAARELGVVLP